MSVEFIGIDPDTGKSGSPTVWVEDEELEIIVQSDAAETVWERGIEHGKYSV
ncbi:hypothetical protein [Streptacidiphilus cavernicola]|uniref:Uncharacterized protein n=1 Tax=Streptacidiphilus cavernicola TaxID=3342716 RepID=A0ABV6VZZ8_9ACTN